MGVAVLTGIRDLRVELADAVGEVIQTETYWPEAFSPPGALIKAGTPFIEAGETFREVKVRFQIWILTDDDEEQLEDKVVAVVGRLDDYDIESIEIEPQIDGGVLAGARLILTTVVDKEELF